MHENIHYINNVSSNNHRRYFKELLRKTLKYRRLAPHKDNSSIEFAPKSAKFHQNISKHSSTKIQWSSNVWETSTITYLLIFNVCIEISIVHQYVFRESSMKQKRNGNVSEISRQKNLWSLNFAFKSPLFQQYLFEESSGNHQRRNNETWMFPRLAS